jgi:hypothetical protein
VQSARVDVSSWLWIPNCLRYSSVSQRSQRSKENRVSATCRRTLASPVRHSIICNLLQLEENFNSTKQPKPFILPMLDRSFL